MNTWQSTNSTQEGTNSGAFATPNPDTIQEFKIQTSNYDAGYGRNPGANVNVITKSGTNAFHGSGFEFFRNKSLNAKGFYDPVKPDSIQNQFGGTIGGPIKKDKTFFFGSYEGRRIKLGKSSNPVPLPTEANLAGDFSNSTDEFAGTLASAQVVDRKPIDARAYAKHR